MADIINSFTYFDQFVDTEIDLTDYFKNIKTYNNIDYTFTSIQPVRVTLKNMFTKIELVESFKKSANYFDNYVIKDDDTIENISFRTYNDLDLWWIIAIFNNIKNLYNDFPMTNEQLEIIANQYVKTENIYSFSVYYNMLFERNEKKRNIVLLNNNYLNDVITAFRTEFNRYNI